MLKPINSRAVLGLEPYWKPDVGNYNLGGTGTRLVHSELRNETKGWIRDRVEFIRPTGIVTGGCVGFDHLMGEYCALRWPDLSHTVIVPADRTAVAAWWTGFSNVEVIYMPTGTTYRDRNIELVKRSAVMLGQPERPENDPKSVRSGTWQAVRLARRAGVGVDLALTDWLREQDQRRRPSTGSDLRG